MAKLALESRWKLESRIYPVYAFGSPIIGCKPLFYCTRSERDAYLDDGSCRPLSRGKALQLTICLAKFRGLSAQMGPRMIEDFADGRNRAKSALEAWMPQRLRA